MAARHGDVMRTTRRSSTTTSPKGTIRAQLGESAECDRPADGAVEMMLRKGTCHLIRTMTAVAR